MLACGRSPLGEEPAVACAQGQRPVSSVLTREGRPSGSPQPVSSFQLPPFPLADEAQEAEAIQILTSVWNIRESTSDTAPQKTIFVLNTLVMLYYLMMNSSKASFPRKAPCLMEVEVPLVEFSCVLPSCTGFCPLSKAALQKSSDVHDVSHLLSPACIMETALSSSRGICPLLA